MGDSFRLRGFFFLYNDAASRARSPAACPSRFSPIQHTTCRRRTYRGGATRRRAPHSLKVGQETSPDGPGNAVAVAGPGHRLPFREVIEFVRMEVDERDEAGLRR